MELPTTKITLKSLVNTDIIVTYKSVISEWDLEQIDQVLLKAMTFDEKGKPDVDLSKQGTGLITDRDNAQINALVVNVEGLEIAEGEDYSTALKKAISRAEYKKFDEAIDAVCNPVSPEEKKSSQDNLSSDSQENSEKSPEASA